MSRQLMMAAFVMGIIFLGAALFIPQLITPTQSQATEHLNLTEGDSSNLTDRLEVSVPSVNAAGPNVTVEYQDLTDFSTNATLVNETESETLELSGDNITTTVQGITNNNTVLAIDYPPMFQWNSGARTFVENVDIILALLGSTLLVVSIGGIFSNEF